MIVSGNPPSPLNAGPRKDAQDKQAPSILDLLTRGAQTSLDHIEEPTAADLAELDDAAAIKPALDEAIDLRPALALLAEAEEPELVSLEGLDEAEAPASTDEELDDVDELLEDVESLIEDYVDVELDDELDDEGYDLDDDDISSYHDLYGDDDTIIPSFREGEFAEEEDGDSAYYDDLR